MEPVPQGTVRAQILRSAADWSHGILLEDSIQRESYDSGWYAMSSGANLVRGIYWYDQRSEPLHLHRESVL